MTRIAVIALGLALGAAAITPPVASASDRSTIRHLRHELRTARRQRHHWASKYRSLKQSYQNLETSYNAAAIQAASVPTLEGMVTRLQAQVGSVAGLIGAVPTTSGMLSTVIAPARDRWRALGGCASTYTADGYWSIDFSPPGFC